MEHRKTAFRSAGPNWPGLARDGVAGFRKFQFLVCLSLSMLQAGFLIQKLGLLLLLTPFMSMNTFPFYFLTSNRT